MTKQDYKRHYAVLEKLRETAGTSASINSRSDAITDGELFDALRFCFDEHSLGVSLICSEITRRAEKKA